MRPERRFLPGLGDVIPDLEAFVQEDSSSRNIMCLAESLWMLGDPEKAIDALEVLLARDRSAISARVLLGWCYEDAARPGDATRILTEARDLDPANPFLAELVTGAGSRQPLAELTGETEAEPERALTQDELAEVPPGPLYSVTLAEIFERQGFDEKAYEIYSAILEAHPERGDIAERVQGLKQRIAGEPSG